MRHKGDMDMADARIAALAARQGGVVSTRQLLALALDRSAIARRVRKGWLHPLHRGVYAVGHTALGANGRWHGAVLACGDGAVLSHRSAAAAWELRPMPSGPVDVSVPIGGRRRRPGLRLHRTVVEPGERTVLDGLAITTPERTLLDIAPLTEVPVLETALEQAEFRHMVDRSELDRLAASGRPGSPALRAALAEPFVTTRSVLERRMLGLCKRHGLPLPVTNTIVCGHQVDFLWSAHRLIAETDGRHHRGRRAFEQDRRRDADLLVAGYRVIRFTHRRVVYEPAWVAERLKALLTNG